MSNTYLLLRDLLLPSALIFPIRRGQCNSGSYYQTIYHETALYYFCRRCQELFSTFKKKIGRLFEFTCPSERKKMPFDCFGDNRHQTIYHANNILLYNRKKRAEKKRSSPPKSNVSKPSLETL